MAISTYDHDFSGEKKEKTINLRPFWLIFSLISLIIDVIMFFFAEYLPESIEMVEISHCHALTTIQNLSQLPLLFQEKKRHDL